MFTFSFYDHFKLLENNNTYHDIFYEYSEKKNENKTEKEKNIVRLSSKYPDFIQLRFARGYTHAHAVVEYMYIGILGT